MKIDATHQPVVDLGLIEKEKLQSIVNARSRREALRMTSAKDIAGWIRGNARHEMISRVADAIYSIKDSNITNEETRFENFKKLCEMSLPEYKKQFKADLAGPLNNKNWGYSLSVAGHEIYSSGTRLPPHHPLFPRILAHNIHISAKSTFREHEETLIKPENLREANFQCMAESGAWREILALQDDPAYSRSNLVRVENQDDPDKFIAVFKGDRQLEFSNRIATNGEFRGKRLLEALTRSDYRNLGELASAGHLTEHDVRLRYAMNITFGELYRPAQAILQQTAGGEGVKALNRELWKATIGNTTLGALWQLPVANVPASLADASTNASRTIDTTDWMRN